MVNKLTKVSRHISTVLSCNQNDKFLGRSARPTKFTLAALFVRSW